jgi:hypothetical protein
MAAQGFNPAANPPPKCQKRQGHTEAMAAMPAIPSTSAVASQPVVISDRNAPSTIRPGSI